MTWWDTRDLQRSIENQRITKMRGASKTKIDLLRRFDWPDFTLWKRCLKLFTIRPSPVLLVFVTFKSVMISASGDTFVSQPRGRKLFGHSAPFPSIPIHSHIILIHPHLFPYHSHPFASNPISFVSIHKPFASIPNPFQSYPKSISNPFSSILNLFPSILNPFLAISNPFAVIPNALQFILIHSESVVNLFSSTHGHSNPFQFIRSHSSAFECPGISFLPLGHNTRKWWASLCTKIITNQPDFHMIWYNFWRVTKWCKTF